MELKINEFIYYYREYIAGFINGLVGSLVSHPIDTIKVRFQADTSYKSSQECLYQLLKYEGPSALYKGVVNPLIANTISHSMLFGIDGHIKKIYQKQLGDPSILTTLIIGSFASAASSVVLIPTEHVRIKMQMQKGSVENNKYKSTIDCYQTIIKENGIKGLYKGTLATIMRESYPGGAYLVSYELMSKKCAQYSGYDRQNVYSINYAIIGYISGTIYWTLCYPFDLVKTKMQADCFVNPQFNSFTKTMKDLIKQGIKECYRGYLVVALRSGPLNALAILVYEKTLHYLDNFKN